MDDLDRKILQLLSRNARIPVKDIAEEINLTSPAVSSRIRKLEREGIISGYTVILRPPESHSRVDALISVASLPSIAEREEFLAMLSAEPQVLQCYRVTGSYSFIVKVSCPDVDSLEHLLTKFQKAGSTSTQIILSTPVDHPLTY